MTDITTTTPDAPPPMPAPTGNPTTDHANREAHFKASVAYFEKTGSRSPNAGPQMVQASEQRAAAATEALGGVDEKYIADLKAARVAQGGRPSAEFNRAFEVELSQALAGRKRGEGMDAFLTRSGQTMTEEQKASHLRDAARAKAEGTRAVVPPEWRAAGYVAASEFDSSGYALPNGQMWKPETATYLAACKVAGVSQSQLNAILKELSK